MKVGDIAYLDKTEMFGFVRINEIEYEEVEIVEKVKNGWFSSKEVPTGKFKKEIKLVWWVKVGYEFEQTKHSSLYSAYYDWDEMIRKASALYYQAKILVREEDKENGLVQR